MKRAQINVDGIVVDTFPETVEIEGQTFTLAERFHPDFVAQLVPVADEVQAGWVRSGDDFVAPSAPAAPPVPQVVSRAQGKLALLAVGLLDDVEQAIAGMTGDDLRRATIEWNERATFERQSPFLLQMAAALGLDDAALDALFVDAASR